MITPGPVTVHTLDGPCRFGGELRKEDLFMAALGEGSFRFQGSLNWENVPAPLFLIASGGAPLSLQGSGSALVLTVSSPLIDSLLRTSYGGRLTPLVRIVRDGGIPAYKPSLRDRESIGENIRSIGEEAEYGEPEWEQVVQLHLLELFLLCRRMPLITPGERQGFERGTHVWSVAHVASYLRDHYDDRFTLEDLASRCALNATYFSRAFKAYAGVPLFEYINRLRIERACGLLRDTDRTVLDIALAVGYNNVSFFNRYFRRLLGESPGAYRKRVR